MLVVHPGRKSVGWPAAGFKDTELGVSMKQEVRHGATEVYAGFKLEALAGKLPPLRLALLWETIIAYERG